MHLYTNPTRSILSTDQKGQDRTRKDKIGQDRSCPSTNRDTNPPMLFYRTTAFFLGLSCPFSARLNKISENLNRTYFGAILWVRILGVTGVSRIAWNSQSDWLRLLKLLISLNGDRFPWMEIVTVAQWNCFRLGNVSSAPMCLLISSTVSNEDIFKEILEKWQHLKDICNT